MSSSSSKGFSTNSNSLVNAGEIQSHVLKVLILGDPATGKVCFLL